MIEYKGVAYYELKDCKYVNPDLKVANASKLLYELQIAKQRTLPSEDFGRYPIWLPFEFEYPVSWTSKFRETHEIYGEYCLVLLEAKRFQHPSRSQLKYYKADGIPGAYYATNIYLTREGMSKIREYVENNPSLFPVNYTDFAGKLY